MDELCRLRRSEGYGVHFDEGGNTLTTEQELVAQAKAGDQDAFEQLLVQNQDRVFSLAFRMVGSREDAADLAQEAFLKAWTGLPSFQGDSSFATWVYRLTTNVCIDFIRKQQRRQNIQPVASLEDEENWTEPADSSQDPQHRLEARERSEALEKGLKSLPDHHRQVLVMREMSGLSYQEIAQALELDLGTVKSRIARARNTLRKFLLAEGNLFHAPPSKPSEKKNDK